MTLDDSIEAFCRLNEISRDDVEALLEPLRRELAESRELAEMFRPWFEGQIGHLDTSGWTQLLDEYVKLKLSEPEGEPTRRTYNLLVAAFNTLWEANRHYSQTFAEKGASLLVFMQDRWRIRQLLEQEKALTAELTETVRLLSDTELRDALIEQARERARTQLAAPTLSEVLDMIGLPGDEPLTEAELGEVMRRLGPAPGDVE